MIDSIKKAMLASVGAAMVTAEKVEEALSDWVEKGKVSADEAKEMARKMGEQGKKEFEKASDDVQEALKELMEKAGMGQRDRVDALEKRLLALEIEVANLATHQRSDSSK